MRRKVVWVDLPVIGYDRAKRDVFGRWNAEGEFIGEDAKERAVKWLRKMFGEGAVGDEGKVSLLSFGETGEEGRRGYEQQDQDGDVGV